MWLTRGTKKCFYRATRINGRPRCVYVGTGPEAERVAAEIEARKRARMEASRAFAAWKTRVGATEGPLDELCSSLELLVAASLLAQGYHRHDRSAWRKRRERIEVPTQ